MKITRLIGLALIWTLAATTHAQSYKVLLTFNPQFLTPLEPGLIAQSRGGYLLSAAPDSSQLHGGAYRVTTSGALTILHAFNTPAGNLPAGGLTLARNGRFYGTTYNGGEDDAGIIFEMTPDGIVKTLHEFAGGSDAHPQPPPIQSLYGDFYGTTAGDQSNPGAIYKIDSLGNYSLLHTFAGDTFSGAEGSNPAGALVQDATNFWFYGTAEHGGTQHLGTIFRVNSSGDFETLFTFDNDHGAYPVAMIQANDGNYYGVTYQGGPRNQGVVFKMTPARQVTVLYDFTGGTDGGEPLGGFLQASDGYLYGNTTVGGLYGGGVLFRISTTGSFTVVNNFQQSTGNAPIALMQHTNGFLYGQTHSGPTGAVFFRFDAGLAPFVMYLDTYGRAGDTVQLLGDYFTTNSQVFFNGMPAQVTEVQKTYMKVVVPGGATTGPITVTTTKGTLQSNKPFIVRP